MVCVRHCMIEAARAGETTDGNSCSTHLGGQVSCFLASTSSPSTYPTTTRSCQVLASMATWTDGPFDWMVAALQGNDPVGNIERLLAAVSARGGTTRFVERHQIPDGLVTTRLAT